MKIFSILPVRSYYKTTKDRKYVKMCVLILLLRYDRGFKRSKLTVIHGFCYV